MLTPVAVVFVGAGHAGAAALAFTLSTASVALLGHTRRK